MNQQSHASEPASPVWTNLQEPTIEPTLLKASAPKFSKGFETLTQIPKYQPDQKRDASLISWLEVNEITQDVFFRAATALASNWPPKTSRNPDPWLSVRTYSLNQKQWDAARGQTASNRARPKTLHDKRREMEDATPPLREPKRIGG